MPWPHRRAYKEHVAAEQRRLGGQSALAMLADTAAVAEEQTGGGQ